MHLPLEIRTLADQRQQESSEEYAQIYILILEMTEMINIFQKM